MTSQVEGRASQVQAPQCPRQLSPSAEAPQVTLALGGIKAGVTLPGFCRSCHGCKGCLDPDLVFSAPFPPAAQTPPHASFIPMEAVADPSHLLHPWSRQPPCPCQGQLPPSAKAPQGHSGSWGGGSKAESPCKVSTDRQQLPLTCV